MEEPKAAIKETKPTKKRMLLGLFSSLLTAIFIILFGFGLFSFSENYPSIYGYPNSHGGTLDFSGYNLSGDSKLINLVGETRLYYNRWVIDEKDDDKEDATINIKRDWTETGLPKEGYGTYEWTFSNLSTDYQIAFRLGGDVYVPFKAYLVDESSDPIKLITAHGKMSKDQETIFTELRSWPRDFIEVSGSTVKIYLEFSFITNANPTGPIYTQTSMDRFKDASFFIYASIGGTAVVFMLVLSITMLISSRDKHLAFPFFLLALSFAISYLFTDFLAIFGGEIGFLLTHTAEKICNYFSSLLVFLALSNFITNQRGHIAKSKIIFFSSSILVSIIMFFSLFQTRLVYLCMIPLLLYSLFFIYEVVSNPKGSSPKIMIPLLLVHVIFLLFLVFDFLDFSDILVYSLACFPSVALVAMALFSSYFYFVVTKDLRDKALKAEENALLYERAETKNLLEAVSPHFLFNSLTLVESNYHSSLDEGDKAISLLSKNLRSSIDATTKSLIPFVEELDNISNYSDYNALRKDEDIEVLFDIGYEDFEVPPLSIQVFVENSLKHAFVVKKKDMHIIVRTSFDGERIKIEVIDNGSGFDPSKVDSTKHSGLANGSARLKMALGAETKIDSKIDMGTTITILFHKKEAPKVIMNNPKAKKSD